MKEFSSNRPPRPLDLPDSLSYAWQQSEGLALSKHREQCTMCWRHAYVQKVIQDSVDQKIKRRSQHELVSLTRCSESSSQNCLKLGLDPESLVTDGFIPPLALVLSHTVSSSFSQAAGTTRGVKASSPGRKKIQAGASSTWGGSEHWLPH